MKKLLAGLALILGTVAWAAGTTTLDNLAVRSNATVGGTLGVSSTISGNGSLITALSASNLTTGTVPAARLPNPTAGSLGGVESLAAITHDFLTQIGTDGSVTQARPACGDLSNSVASCSTDATNASNITTGTLPAGQLPSPTASTLGGVKSLTVTSHQWINTISTAGLPASTQPAFTDISSGQCTKAQGCTGADNSSVTFAASGTIFSITPQAHSLILSGSSTIGVILPPDASSTKVLTAQGVNADPVWASVGTAPVYTDNLSNLGLSVTQSSGILTIAVKQSDGSTDPSTGSAAVGVPMQIPGSTSTTVGNYSFTAAASLAVSVDTTMGFMSGSANYLYIYAIDSDGAGTLKVGVSSNYYDSGTKVTSVKDNDTITCTNASPTVCTVTGTTLLNDDAVMLTTGGTLPAGLSPNQIYYVKGLSGSTFNLAGAPDSSNIVTTTNGSGTHKIHVADGRMVSDGYYSSKSIRLIGRTSLTETTGSWGSATQTSLPPFFTGRQIVTGQCGGLSPCTGTDSVGHTNSGAITTTATTIGTDITTGGSKVSVTFVPGKTGYYKIMGQAPFFNGAGARMHAILAANSVAASPVTVFNTEGSCDDFVSNDVCPMTWWDLVYLTSGTPYSFNTQAWAGSGTTTMKNDVPTNGTQLTAEQAD